MLATPPGRAQQSTTAPAANHLEHRFQNPREWAKSFDDLARNEWQMLARVVEALNLKAEQIVADIGAGMGYFTVRLETHWRC